MVGQRPAVEVAAEVGRQVPVGEDVRGDVTVCVGCARHAPTGEERELQPGDERLVPTERKVDFSGDRSKLLLVGEGRDERVRARVRRGDGAA